ncbi:MAG: carboxypeptidase-like regulatory domain-containing protein, partial [Planctomycetota bacterium]
REHFSLFGELATPIEIKCGFDVEDASRLIIGGDCEILVYADDESAGVLNVEAAFDLDGSGEFPEQGKVFAGAAVGNGQWKIGVKTLPDVGKQTLLVRSTDRVGNVSAAIPHDLDVRLPVTADEVTVDANLVRLEGTVRYRGKTVSAVEVTLTPAGKDAQPPGKKPISVRSNEEGLYEIPDLQPGPYKIRARAVIRNRVHLVDKQEILKSGPEGKHKLDLLLP